jgi:menaquinone-specific isochorismate synthase
MGDRNTLYWAQIMIQQAKLDLLTKLQALVDTPPDGPTRIEVPIPNRSGLNWLYENPNLTRIWWQDRDQQNQVAGLGIADQIKGEHEISCAILSQKMTEKLRYFPEATYYGAIRFPSIAPISTLWKPFGYHRFILPLFEWRKHNASCTLSVNWVPKPFLNPQDQLHFIIDELAKLQFNYPQIPEPEPAHSVQDTPTKPEWDHRLTQCQHHFQEHYYKKIVLAKKTSLTFKQQPDPTRILNSLIQGGYTNSAFQYMIQLSPTQSFLGISPERLYRKKGHYLFTEAVAGTRAKPTVPAPENLLPFLESPAEMEHHWVAKMLFDALGPLSVAHSPTSDIQILDLPTVQHLYQTFQAQLKSHITNGVLLSTLFPTPAVAGYPVQETLPVIAATEAFDRGWYAGLVGTWSRDETQFAVAIRSGLIDEHHLHLFSGAGIIENANPDHEWDEVNNKIKPYLDILT